MQITLWIFAVIGGIATLTVLGVIAAIFYNDWCERRQMAKVEFQIHNHQYRLQSDSWWFSEDPPTMNLLQGLAAGISVDSVRDTWRKERREQAAKSEPTHATH